MVIIIYILFHRLQRQFLYVALIAILSRQTYLVTKQKEDNTVVVHSYEGTPNRGLGQQ